MQEPVEFTQSRCGKATSHLVLAVPWDSWGLASPGTFSEVLDVTELRIEPPLST